MEKSFDTMFREMFPKPKIRIADRNFYVINSL